MTAASEDPIPSRFVRGADVVRMVAEHCDMTTEELVGRSRRRPTVRARWLAVRMLHRQGRSSPEIGKLLKMDHSSVLWCLRQLEVKLKTDPALVESVNHLDMAYSGLHAAEEARRERLKSINSLAPTPEQRAVFDALRRIEEAKPAPIEPVKLEPVVPEERIRKLRSLGWSDNGISRQLNVPLEVVKQRLRYYEGEVV